LFIPQFKGKCRNCGKLGHKEAQCKSKQVKDEKLEVMCNYCKKSGRVKANCVKLLRKNLGMNNSGGTQHGQNGVGGTTDNYDQN
jgi:hypothetical protein